MSSNTLNPQVVWLLCHGTHLHSVCTGDNRADLALKVTEHYARDADRSSDAAQGCCILQLIKPDVGTTHKYHVGWACTRYRVRLAACLENVGHGACLFSMVVIDNFKPRYHQQASKHARSKACLNQ
jgi:hypothetical protein